MKKIVIISSYGDKNIGDAALLDMTVRYIEKSIRGKMKITIQSVNPNLTTVNVKHKSPIAIVASPYGLAIQSKDGVPVSGYAKFFRTFVIFFSAFRFLMLGVFKRIDKQDHKNIAYITSIRDADYIFGVGGGYIRTKTHVRDFFGLSLTLLPIWIAGFYKKQIMFLPMSFGNFANVFHKQLAIHTLKNHRVVIRDEVSLKEFNSSIAVSNKALLLPDLALSYPNVSVRKKSQNGYISISAREWLGKSEQEVYERSLADFSKYIWRKYHLKTVFVPMTWNETEDDDNRVAERIKMFTDSMAYFEVIHVIKPSDAQVIFSGGVASVCTRMHSAILSFTVGTPFLCLAYEHKTHGLLKQLDLERWNIDIHEVTTSNLRNKFDSLMSDHYIEVKDKIYLKRLSVSRREKELISEIQNFVGKANAL